MAMARHTGTTDELAGMRSDHRAEFLGNIAHLSDDIQTAKFLDHVDNERWSVVRALIVRHTTDETRATAAEGMDVAVEWVGQLPE